MLAEDLRAYMAEISMATASTEVTAMERAEKARET